MLGCVHLWITYFLMSYVDCNIGIESKDLIFGIQGILGSVGSMFSTPPDKQVSHHLLSLMNLQQLSFCQVDTHWMFESGIMDVFIMLGPGPKDVSR